MIYSFFDRPEFKLSKGGKHYVPVGASSSGKLPQRDAVTPRQPAWAKGLQRLYDDVVEEALPDDLASLLDQLDRAADDK